MKAVNVLLGALTGLAVGATLGILYAPDSGASTRQKISKKGQKYATDLRNKSNEFADMVGQKLHGVKDEGQRVADQWKQKAHNVEADLKHKV